MKKQIKFIFSLFTLILITCFCDAQVSVISPNGGEVWSTGTSKNITWNFSGASFGMLTIDYSVDSGNTWINITSGVTAAAGVGTYAWTVPNTPSSKCYVKISSGSNNSDISDATFSIVNGTGTSVICGSNINNSILLYPRPATDFVKVNTRMSIVINSAKIYNMMGALVSDIPGNNFESSTSVISLADFPVGIYFFVFETSKGIIKKKIAVAR